MINRITAYYYDGSSSKQHEVTVSLYDSILQFHGETAGSHTINIIDLEVTPRVGSQSKRVIHLKDNASLEINSDEFVSQLLEQKGFSAASFGFNNLAYVLESKWRYALMAFVIFIALVWGFYAHGIPYLAKKVAYALPIKTDRTLGNGSLVVIDKLFGFKKTGLSKARQTQIRTRFDNMVKQVDNSFAIRLVFRKSPRIGANAFALPSGIIVLTDELIALAGDDDEIYAVLAHELGHVANRHSLRMVLQSGALALLVAVYTGDISASSTLAAEFPVILAHMSYSRQFETEADIFSLNFMLNNKVSPLAFVRMMTKLESYAKDKMALKAKVKTNKDSVNKSQTQKTSFLDSHPSTHDRLKRFRDAAKKMNYK